MAITAHSRLYRVFITHLTPHGVGAYVATVIVAADNRKHAAQQAVSEIVIAVAEDQLNEVETIHGTTMKHFEVLLPNGHKLIAKPHVISCHIQGTNLSALDRVREIANL